MEKLQLYINITLQGYSSQSNQGADTGVIDGYRNILDINGDPAVKTYVEDASPVLECIDYDAQKKNIFYLLKYIPQGVFLTVLRTIPDQKPSHLAAWIFIPYQINISDLEISNIVGIIDKAVNQSKISTEAMAEIRDILSHQYPTVENAGAIAPNRGKHYAHRFYSDTSGYTLDDLIGKKRYQTSYLPYAGMILAERKTVRTIYGADLTDDPLEQMVKLLPPKSDNPSYSPTIFGQPFDKPYLVPLMGSVELVWESPDNNDFRQSIIVSRPNMQPESFLPPQTSRPAPKPEPQPAPKETVQTVVVADPKPEPATKPKEPPTQYTKPRPTPPPRLVDDIEDPGPFDFNSCNSTKAVWGLIGLIVGVCLTLICTCSRGDDTPEKAVVVNGAQKIEATDSVKTAASTSVTTADQQQSPSTSKEGQKKEESKADNATSPQAPAGGNIDAAIKYLDSNTTWSKAQLESYPDLAGLFDDMNTLNKQKLAKVWGKKLAKSKTFQKIVAHTEYNSKKPRLPEGQTTFLKPGDKQEIYIQRFLNTIDP